ncbi:MAG: ATP-binding protein [Streptosporangiales bacterium]|nr:ATP-binding protein [Streptosporangiales bacterium]
MDSLAGSGHQPARTGQEAGGRRSCVLGTLTVPGRPEQVVRAREFVTHAVSGTGGIDSDAATLLTSELVTNAIQHTRSGHGGSVAVTVIGLPDGVLIEVTDQGAAEAPAVKSELYGAEGHGLYLVQQLAGRWGYLYDPAGTTVWFHLAVPAAASPPESRPRAPIARPPVQRLRPVLP